ncbi:MAG: dolichyl-phosphate-mannose--protein mannosyltransferase, partial [Sphingomonas sp.]
MTPESPPRPRLVVAILGAIAQALFSIRAVVPHKLVFDEVHYVPAARQLLTLSGPTNIEHPLFGKELIAAGILLFGDNSLGWRFFALLAGTATVMGVFAIGWLIFRQVRTATLAA